MIRQRFSSIAVGCAILLSPVCLRGAEPATAGLPVLSPVYTIACGGAVRRYELAGDELSVNRNGRREERRLAGTAAEGLPKLAQAEREQQPGSDVELVVYEQGRTRSPASRAFVTRRLLVQPASGADVTELAQRLDLRLAATPHYAPGTVIFEAATSESALRAMEALRAAPGILAADVLLARLKPKKTVPDDPLFSSQWHLQNLGQSGGAWFIDANVTSAWNRASGRGVTIGVVDDGVEHTHPDLAPNYNASLAYDFNDQDTDPWPSLAEDTHGTMCAGMATARGNNALGVSGVAREATLTAYRLISEAWTDEQEAEAFLRHNEAVDIKSNSWGAADDGMSIEGPGTLAAAALAEAATTGRQGRGTIVVFCGGNGLDMQDNSNNDGYANSVYTIGVGAVNDFGFQSWYSEPGANLLVCSPSNGGGHNQAITTTDLTGSRGENTTGLDDLADLNYTRNFGGTSASAPLVAGVVALMLQANPQLGWRDVQEILIRSARRIHRTDPDWSTNGAGLTFNHKYGAGLVDAGAAVALAEDWINLGSYASRTLSQTGLGQAIPDNASAGVTRTFTFDAPGFRVERVTVMVDIAHPARGDLAVTLTSPSGTISRLAEQHTDGNSDYPDWTFSTVHHWGESATGAWKVRVADQAFEDAGRLNAVSVTLHGSVVAGPQIVGAGAVLAAETNLPANQAVDPGERVTCDLRIKQLAGAAVSGVVATLLPVGGVSDPSAPQTYGPLTVGGPAAERSFAFTARGGCGTFVNPILRLTAGAEFLGYAHFALPLGTAAQSTFTGGAVTIRDDNTANPHPATLAVPDLAGRVQNLRVNINGFSHGYPDDVGLLLVSPGELEQVIMDGATDQALVRCNLAFDDNAPVYLPFSGPTPSGSYKPFDYYGSPFTGDPGFEPAFTLGEFNGVPASGQWRLYAEDFASGDSGSITSWQLVFTAVDCTDNVDLTPTDLAVAESAGAAWLTVNRTGGKEGSASVRVLTADDSAKANKDYLPIDDVVTFAPGELSRRIAVTLASNSIPEANRTFWVRLQDAAGNTRLGTASQATVTIVDDDAATPLDLALVLTGTVIRLQMPTQRGWSYEVQTSSDLSRWTVLEGGIAGTGGVVEVQDSTPASQPWRYYRVKATLTGP